VLAGRVFHTAHSSRAFYIEQKNIKKNLKTVKYSGRSRVYHYGQVSDGSCWFSAMVPIKTLALLPLGSGVPVPRSQFNKAFRVAHSSRVRIVFSSERGNRERETFLSDELGIPL
jgi:hypothetical protein